MQYIQNLLTVIELVKVVEKMIPEKGQGAAKLELVRKMLEESVGTIQEIWPSIEKTISLFVKLANVAGTFKK